MGVFTSKHFIVYAHTSHQIPEVKRLPIQDHVTSPGSFHEPKHLPSVSDLPASRQEHGSKITATTKHLHSIWLTVHLDAEVDTRQHSLRLFLPIICKFKLKLLMSDCLCRPIYVTQQARAPSLWTPPEWSQTGADLVFLFPSSFSSDFLTFFKKIKDRYSGKADRHHHFYLSFVLWSVTYNFNKIFLSIIGLFLIIIN